jgi:hypothetical protein
MTMDYRVMAPRSTHGRRRSRTRAAALLTAAMTLAVAATALAAHPKAGGKYSGATSQAKIEGFSAPVTFTVSASGTKLLHFTYGSLGCLGSGGFRPGVNPFTGGSLYPVGTISVAANGHFAIAKVKQTDKLKGKDQPTLVTVTAVTGKFTSAKRASGKVTFTQTDIPPHAKSFSCGPVTRTFTVKIKGH